MSPDLFSLGFYYGSSSQFTFLNRAVGISVFVCWFAAIMLSSFVLHNLEMGWMSMWNINFFFGMLAYLAYVRLPNWSGLPVAALGVGLLVALAPRAAYDSLFEAQQALPWDLLVLGIPFFLILLGFALAEQRYKFIPTKPLLLIGEASYAIYLVHSAAISLLCQILFRFQIGQSSPNVIFCCIFAAATIAGLLAHLLIERPLTWLVRNKRFQDSRLSPGFR